MADAVVPSSPTPPTPPPAAPAVKAPPKPKPADEKVFVWPDLVAEEFVAALFFLTFLCAWSLWIDSPLEQPADPNRTPNPSKAPWYFLGLQELLVYFDPWIAGVILPGVIIVGLILIPYLDNDQRGVGYYSVKERPLASWIFLSGLGMWFTLIFIGTFMRGPSWGLYMPWESWHVHKPFPPSTWSFTTSPRLGAVPSYPSILKFLAGTPPKDATGVYIDLPVWPGVAFLLAYFGLGMTLPKKWFPNFARTLGPVKYAIVMALLLLMIFVPVKMILRLGFAIKYILSVPSVSFRSSSAW